jgi:DNA-binding NarL/FixJ family response regulator
MPLLELDPPDVILLDLDDGYGPEHVADLHTRLRAKVLVLTCTSDGKLLDRIVQAGARGILRKQEAPPQLLDAVETVGRGARFTSGLPAQRLPMTLAGEQASRADQGKLATLTRRERESVEALVSNASAPVKVIADGLGISEHTLRNHLCTVYSKLGVRSRLELHAFAADLLEAYRMNTGLVYGGVSYTAVEIQRIVNRVDVVVFPDINPDGRNHSQTPAPTGYAMWRKNRNPESSGGDPKKIGVDVNRNYDFLWDFETTFHPSAVNTGTLASKFPDSDLFHGKGPFSEAESSNGSLVVLGFYHSHPDHPARPSDFDRSRAWPFYSYVIVSIQSRQAVDMTSWVLDDASGSFVRQDIVDGEPSGAIEGESDHG